MATNARVRCFIELWRFAICLPTRSSYLSEQVLAVKGSYSEALPHLLNSRNASQAIPINENNKTDNICKRRVIDSTYDVCMVNDFMTCLR